MTFFDELIAKKVIRLWKGLRDDDLDVLIDVIMKSSVLETLDLGLIYLGDGKLTAAIVQNRTIQQLYLRHNNIGVEGATKLANALKHNCILKVLWLDGYNISDEGTKILANMLMYNNTLQDIFLICNNISDEGAKSLATSFKINSSLKRLYLNGNRIGDEGAKSMADALKYNNTIENVYLEGNNASKDAMQKVVDAIERTSMDDEEVSVKDDEASSHVSLLEAVLRGKNVEIRKKNEEIASLKESLKNSKPIVDTVDLTSGESEPASKRPRTEDTAKSNLAIMHEQTQKMVQVKQEKNAVEATLEAVQGEKEAAEANLEEVKEDLEDSNELAGQLTLTTNVWQGRFDELVSLVQAGGRIDGAMISEIRNRPLLS